MPKPPDLDKFFQNTKTPVIEFHLDDVPIELPKPYLGHVVAKMNATELTKGKIYPVVGFRKDLLGNGLYKTTYEILCDNGFKAYFDTMIVEPFDEDAYCEALEADF